MKNPLRAYHYTSINNWEDIRHSRRLEPRTRPYLFAVDAFDDNHPELETFFRGAPYITTANSRDFTTWKEYGLFDDLMIQVGRRSSGAAVLLSFPIEDYERTYVLDHSHLSPKTFLELYGEDLWAQKFGLINLSMAGSRDDQRKRKIFYRQTEKYADTAIKLSKYDGSFKVPELWVRQIIPWNKIRLEAVEFSNEFQSFPNFVKKEILSKVRAVKSL